MVRREKTDADDVLAEEPVDEVVIDFLTFLLDVYEGDISYDSSEHSYNRLSR
jgi:hypothetical protein